MQYVQAGDPLLPEALLATIDPASIAPGSVATPWIDAGNFRAILALIHTGALGASATIDAKLQQAQDASGTGAQDIPGKAITQLTQAGGSNNAQSMIVAPKEQISFGAGYAFVRLSLTVGVAASQVTASLWGVQPGWGGLSPQPLAASVAQVVR